MDVRSLATDLLAALKSMLECEELRLATMHQSMESNVELERHMNTVVPTLLDPGAPLPKAPSFDFLGLASTSDDIRNRFQSSSEEAAQLLKALSADKRFQAFVNEIQDILGRRSEIKQGPRPEMDYFLVPPDNEEVTLEETVQVALERLNSMQAILNARLAESLEVARAQTALTKQAIGRASALLESLPQ